MGFRLIRPAVSFVSTYAWCFSSFFCSVKRVYSLAVNLLGLSEKVASVLAVVFMLFWFKVFVFEKKNCFAVLLLFRVNREKKLL